ncbi:MAG: hypothetical protein PF588_00685, partial [Candidatus Kapabacteria bacterium]|nr:hypothetical protein [Candidatus Kapabacteria bacterium]
MKKSILLFLISMLATSNLLSFSGNGSGTEEDPFQITNVKQLQEIDLDIEAYYILMNDIDAEETKFWNNIDHDNDSTTSMIPTGFVPLTKWENARQIIFDGKDHVIKKLFIYLPKERDVGLFSYSSIYSEIRNVRLENCLITGARNVGSLVGRNTGRVINSYASGKVTGNICLGGLVGVNSSAIVKSSADVELIIEINRGTNGSAGGLVGVNGGDVSLSHSYGIIKGDYEVKDNNHY